MNWPKLVRALPKLKEVHSQYKDKTIRDEAELCDPTLPHEEDDDTDDDDKMDDGDYNVEDLMETDDFENEAESISEIAEALRIINYVMIMNQRNSQTCTRRVNNQMGELFRSHVSSQLLFQRK